MLITSRIYPGSLNELRNLHENDHHETSCLYKSSLLAELSITGTYDTKMITNRKKLEKAGKNCLNFPKECVSHAQAQNWEYVSHLVLQYGFHLWSPVSSTVLSTVYSTSDQDIKKICSNGTKCAK